MMAWYTRLAIGALLVAVFMGYYMIDQFDEECLRGKKVLVTGASAGIGEQMAYHYARYGAKVVVTGRKEEALRRVVARCEEIRAAPGDYHYIAADMSNLPDTARVVQFAVEQLGGLDYLVLNHVFHHSLGYWLGHQENLTQFDTGIDVNFKSYVYLASHARPHIEAARGSFIVVSSIMGKMSMAHSAPYSSAKFALEGFFNGFRQEFIMRKVDVSVSLCIIGFTATKAVMEQMERMGKGERFFSWVSPSDPSQVALSIVKGGALRQREVYHNYWQAKLAAVLRDICPQPLEYMGRYLVQLY